VFEPEEEPVVVEQPAPTIIVEQGCSTASPTTPEKAKFTFMVVLFLIAGALWMIGRKEK